MRERGESDNRLVRTLFTTAPDNINFDVDAEERRIIEVEVAKDGPKHPESVATELSEEFVEELKTRAAKLRQEFQDSKENVFVRIIDECIRPWTLSPELPRGARQCRRILLYGPPGNGKTHFVLERLLHKEKGLNLVRTNDVFTSAGRFMKGIQGESQAAIRTEASKCLEDRSKLYVMVLDETDTAAGDRSQNAHQPSKSDITNELLNIIGNPEFWNLIVIAMTNYPEKLDEAFTRSGRVEAHYFLPSLTLPGRQQLFYKFMSEILNALYDLPANRRFDGNAVRRFMEESLDPEGLTLATFFYTRCINFTTAQFLKVIYDTSTRLGLEKTEEVPENNLTILDTMLSTAHDCVRKYLATSNEANLAWNRMEQTIDESNMSRAAFLDYDSKVLSELRAHDAKVGGHFAFTGSPTGRFIFSMATRKPELLMEMTLPVSLPLPATQHIAIPVNRPVPNENLLVQSLQSLNYARKYDFITVISNETIQAEHTSQFQKEIVKRYKEAETQAEDGLRGLMIFMVDECAGYIAKVTAKHTQTSIQRKRAETQTTHNQNRQLETGERKAKDTTDSRKDFERHSTSTLTDQTKRAPGDDFNNHPMEDMTILMRRVTGRQFHENFDVDQYREGVANAQEKENAVLKAFKMPEKPKTTEDPAQSVWQDVAKGDGTKEDSKKTQLQSSKDDTHAVDDKTTDGTRSDVSGDATVRVQADAQVRTGFRWVNSKISVDSSTNRSSNESGGSTEKIVALNGSVIQHSKLTNAESKQVLEQDVSETMRQEESTQVDEFQRQGISVALMQFARTRMNNFDLRKGPDMLFFVRSNAVLETLAANIDWGHIRPDPSMIHYSKEQDEKVLRPWITTQCFTKSEENKDIWNSLGRASKYTTELRIDIVEGFQGHDLKFVNGELRNLRRLTVCGVSTRNSDIPIVVREVFGEVLRF
ncbi:ATP-dependent zinc metalloprotease FTSH 4, mitochondrial [Rhizophlyctis rosea]|uniref:Vesicular-fusion protein SEC18 n=1 Tax=Rhizophlyctis rosea TaxID=64517 RepID=A0AAD5X5V7_9FUNG|nr:ATP-dependent zinc metalloprotease FTSH 4, mitochondrial [Rhizophlyctis rosea]